MVVTKLNTNVCPSKPNPDYLSRLTPEKIRPGMLNTSTLGSGALKGVETPADFPEAVDAHLQTLRPGIIERFPSDFEVLNMDRIDSSLSGAICEGPRLSYGRMTGKVN
ncbi:hypothetical protein [Nocardia xishanensis]